MASRAKPSGNRAEKTFVFDLQYVRAQANEAFRSYFGPLSGVLSAARGKSELPQRRTKS